MSEGSFDEPTRSTGAAEETRPARATLERGACIGRYVILDQLGSGGMGVVYKAFDPELGRPIALKLLNTDANAAGALHDRLLREAQALARLSHPNVIAVHDVGTFRSDVFIAMEFVEGLTLRKWIKDAPRSGSELLKVFEAAGEGLQAAHRAGLVHRDFKPDNVIVGHDGRVRVLDFGLARAAATELLPAEGGTQAAAPEALVETVGDRPSDSSRRLASPRTPPPSAELPAPSESGRLLSSPLTRVGSVMGTPRYMAPEQHLGQQVDERADQFSFCVSLYEALYGQFPFAGQSIADLKDSVIRGRIEEPPAGARVPRWLRQVLLRGLAAEATARYSTMAALLQALRSDPAVARRRWLPAVAALLASAAAIVSWRVVHRQQVRACVGAERKLAGVWDAGRRAAVAAAFRATGKPYAAAALATVERVFDAYAQGWVTMHTDTCEATHVRGEQSQELLDLRMTCLADRLTQLSTLSDLYATADGPVVERAAQSAQSLPGLQPCADAAALRAPIAAPRDVHTRQRVDEVREKMARASALGLSARFDESLRLGREALGDAEALHYAPLEAEADLRLGQTLGDHGDWVDSARALRRAFVAALAGRDEESAAQAAIHLILAVGIRQERFEDGDYWADVARALAERQHRKDELLGQLYTWRSELREQESKYEEALADATRALELEKRTLGPDHYLVAETYYSLANIYFFEARYAEALDSFQRCLAIHQRSLGPDHPLLSKPMIGMAAVYGESGDHERAMVEYQRALVALRRVQSDHPYIPLLTNNIGNELLLLGRPREALDHFERALAVWQKSLGASRELSDVLYNMGAAKLDIDRPDEALHHFTQALDVCERALGSSHAFCGWVVGGVGDAQLRLGRLDEAMARYQRAVSIIEKALGAKHQWLAAPLLGMGRVELARHVAARAMSPLERALAIREAQPGDGVELSKLRFALAEALSATGERARAVELATRAREAFAKARPPMRKLLAEASGWLDRHR